MQAAGRSESCFVHGTVVLRFDEVSASTLPLFAAYPELSASTDLVGVGEESPGAACF